MPPAFKDWLPVEHEADASGLGLRCVRCVPGGRLHDQVVAFAAKQYDLPEDLVRAEEDAYSEIFAFLDDGTLVGTVTLTLNANGPIEATHCYPQELMQYLGSKIGTFVRWAVAPGYSHLVRTVLRSSLWYGLQRGFRLALISTKPRMVRGYRRIGYQPLSGRPFTHPRLGTDHVALYFTSDPDRRTMFTDLFQEIGGHVRDSDVLRLL